MFAVNANLLYQWVDLCNYPSRTAEGVNNGFVSVGSRLHEINTKRVGTGSLLINQDINSFTNNNR